MSNRDKAKRLLDLTLDYYTKRLESGDLTSAEMNNINTFLKNNTILIDMTDSSYENTALIELKRRTQRNNRRKPKAIEAEILDLPVNIVTQDKSEITVKEL